MMRKLQGTLFVTSLIAISYSTPLHAQISNYNFSTAVGAYTEVAGGTTIFQGDVFNDVDDEYAPVAIPFPFTFNGVPYTTAYVNSNGAVSFGGGHSEYSYPLGVIQDEDAIAVGFGADLWSGEEPSSTVTAQTVGTAPNRTFVIQWKNWHSFDEIDSSNLNFQIRLTEAGGVAANQSVVFSYGPMYLDAFTDIDYLQVGLRGQTTTDFVNRTSTTGWAATTAGIDIEDAILTNATLLPAVGQTITYSTLIPLAITLKEITAVNLGKSNQVIWASEHEDAGDKYILQHSENGKTFIDLVSMNAKGHASEYSYLDNSPFSGTTYYRLKISGRDNKMAFSKIVSASMKGMTNNLTVRPNPAVNYILFDITEQTVNGTVTVLNQLAKAVMVANVKPGENSLDISMLSNGIYTVIYSNGATRQVSRFTKQ